MSQRAARLLYPVLFGLWPVLSLFAANQDEMVLGDLWRPLGVVAAATVVLLLAARALLRRTDKAALAVAAGWLWFFAWRHVEQELRQAYLGEPAVRWPGWCLAAWGVVLAGVLVGIARTRRPLSAATPALIAAALVLVLWPAASIGRYQWQAGRLQLARAAAARPAAGTARPLPGIYHVILDGYARQDVLQEVYGYDNSPFLRFLASRGFQVAGRARANYCQTNLSLASTLNGCYLDEMARSLRDTDYRVPLKRMMADSRAGRGLAALGYEPVRLLWSDRPPDDEPEQHWLSRSLPALNAFEQQVLAMTPLLGSRNQVTGKQMHSGARITLRILDRLDDYPGGRRPVYLFAHMICPHPPFLLPPDEQIVVTEGDGSHAGLPPDRYIPLYRRQLQYLNGQLEAAVDRMLAHLPENSIIILHADHGPGAYLQWERPDRTNMKERLGILLAVRFPPGDQPRLPADMTPVNLYPLIFRHYLGQDWPALPNESYFSTWSKPYRFLRVTDEVK